MQPLISVIVPIYKAELYLRKCINSILAQSYHNLEIILIDDGSPDNCGFICDEYSKKDNRIRTIHQENGGVSIARNVGLQAAHGKYIGFVDPDDWIASDMYECLYDVIERYQANIAVCEYYNCWSKDCSGPHSDTVRIYQNREVMEALLSLKVGNYLWNKLFDRALWTPDIQFPDGKIFEDVRTIYKVMKKCKIMVVIPEIKYYYRRHSSSITRVNQIQNHVECILSRIERFNEIADDFPNQRECMLKIIFEYIPPLRKAICAQDQKSYEMVVDDITAILCFLRIHRNEIFDSRKIGKLGKLSYRLLCRGDRKGWLLSEKLDSFFNQKKKISDSKFIILWRNLVKRLKPLGKFTYYYKYCVYLPIKKALFIDSRGGKDLAGNMFQIAQEACKRGIPVYLSVRHEYKDKVNTILGTGNFSGLRLVARYSRKYYKALGTSKYWFTDMCLDYSAVKRPEQILVNTWHGTPLKLLEFDLKDQRHSMGGGPRDHLKSDYLAVPSRFLFDILLSSSHMAPLFNGKALYCGYPRNSIFFDTVQRQRIRLEKGLEDKELFAYLPTWRDPSPAEIYQEYSIKCILDFFESQLQQNQILFVKLHNFSKEQIDYTKYEKVRPFPTDVDTYTMLNATDCLITDYSSVCFDYANTGKKIVLFTYDQKEYLKNRGLYFSLDEIPFPKVCTYDEMAGELNTVKSYDDRIFLQRFCTYDCPDAAKKLLDVVVDGKAVCETECVAHNGKPNILIYDASLTARLLDDSEVRQILASLDSNEANYFYGYRQDILKKTPSYLQNIPKGIRIISLTSGITYTLWEKLTANLFGSVRSRRLARRELRRQFGGQRFDEVRILGENEYDPFCRILQEMVF